MPLAFWSLDFGQDSKCATSGGDKCYVIPESRQSVSDQESGDDGVEWGSGKGTESGRRAKEGPKEAAVLAQAERQTRGCLLSGFQTNDAFGCVRSYPA